MHLVFLNQYYPPDAAPTGVMLQAVAEECARQGHQVTVICADGGYAGGGGVVGSRLSVVSEDGEEEELSVVSCSLSERKLASAQAQPTTDNRQPTTPSPTSLRIHRLPATRFGRGTFVGKLLDYASYYVGVAWRLGTMNPRPDRIVALTTPPYLSVLARAVSKLRGADHAHWVMDLYPDVMVAHGMLAEGGWKHRLLAGIARWGFGGRRCAAVLTLGPDMAARCGGVVGGEGELSVVSVRCRKCGSPARLLDRPPTTDHRPPSPQWLSVVRCRKAAARRACSTDQPTTDNRQPSPGCRCGELKEKRKSCQLSVVRCQKRDCLALKLNRQRTTDNRQLPVCAPSAAGPTTSWSSCIPATWAWGTGSVGDPGGGEEGRGGVVSCRLSVVRKDSARR